MTALPKAGSIGGALGSTLATACVLAATFALAHPIDAHAAERGVVPDLTWATSTSDQDRTAAALKDVGASWVRLNANWADAEPTKGQYDSWWLAHYDRAIDLARASGARIVLMSYQSPAWASGSTNRETPPKNPADFAHYMGFLASRYKGKVEAYEVWNEENIPRFWSTGPDPAAYVALLKPAYVAIKQADTAAKVVFGGLSLNDYAFVEGAYASGAKGYFDIMSVHPYTCGRPPEAISREPDNRMTSWSFTAYREVRNSMLARGDDKPIWFTEFGWSTTTQSCGVSEATQADDLIHSYRLIEEDPYVQVALWYNFRNNYWNRDEDTIEARYGLMRTDFSPKPAYNALKYYGRTTSRSFAPVADAYVDQSLPVENYGSASDLRLRSSPVQRAYLRFDPRDIPGTVLWATLRLYPTSGSSQGFDVRSVSSNTWTESSIVYGNAPAFATSVTGSSGAVTPGERVSIDVTPLITGRWPVSLALTTTSSNAVALASRDRNVSVEPRLIVTSRTSGSSSALAMPVSDTTYDPRPLSSDPTTGTDSEPTATPASAVTVGRATRRAPQSNRTCRARRRPAGSRKSRCRGHRSAWRRARRGPRGG